MIRPLLFGALVLSAFAVGCGAKGEDGAASASANVTAQEDPDHLRDVAVMSGDIVVGRSSTVGYFPGGYEAGDQDGDIDAWELPYLAWRITTATTADAPAAATTGLKTQTAPRTNGSPLSVSISGNFPGLPEVLVVDSDFNVLASTRAHAEQGLDVATLKVDDTPGEKLVLVRDKLWVLPMSFDISVTQ